MLTRLDIRSFKAFGEPGSEISITPFMLVVGQNGAGKTSVLQAIELFGLLTRGNLQQALDQRSWEYGDLVHLKSTAASMRFVAHVELEGQALEWTLELGKRKHPGVAGETVTRDGEVLMRRTGRSMERRDEATGAMVDQIEQTLTSSWLSALAPEDDDRFPTLGRLARWARGVRPYVVLDPLVLREPSTAHPDGLGTHGEGLAALLRDLSPERRQAAVERTRFHYEPLREVKPTRSAGSGVTRFDVVEARGGSTITLGSRQVSDGLLRLLALAALHELDDKPSVLLFDEIENGVHPHLLGAIVKMLRSLADTGVQVVASTHSPVAASFVGSADEVLLVGRTTSGDVELAPLSASKKWTKMSKAFAPGEAWYALGERKLLDGVEP
ncbi:MAG: AAA family ATPase [Acidimicrobiales bacterium]